MQTLNAGKPLGLIENRGRRTRLSVCLSNQAPDELRLNRDVEIAADAGTDVGEAVEIRGGGVQQVGDCLSLLGIHLRDLRGNGELRLCGLYADQSRRDRHRIHATTDQ